MSLTRRSFLQRLGLVAAALPLAAEVDWERLLWTPRVMVPGVRLATLDEINAVTLANILPGIEDNFFRHSPLLAYLRDHHALTFHGAPIQGSLYYPGDRFETQVPVPPINPVGTYGALERNATPRRFNLVPGRY